MSTLFNSICKADISLHAEREHYPQLGQTDPLFLGPHVLDHAYLVLVSDECTWRSTCIGTYYIWYDKVNE